MQPNLSLRALAVLVLSLALPAAAAPPRAARCKDGEIKVRGACVAACPVQGTLPDPAACECPPGFGKVLFGGGGGECQPVSCGSGPGKDAKLCQCPQGFEKKPARKGKASCVAARPVKASR